MAQLYFDNYTRAGDVTVIAICIVMVILMMTAYVSRTRCFLIFLNIIVSIVIAAVISIVYHTLLAKGDPDTYGMIYVLRVLYQTFLLDVFFLFTLYTTEVSGMEHGKAKIAAIIAATLLVLVVAIDIMESILGVGFRITENGTVLRGPNVFMVGYILYIILLVVVMREARSLLYSRVMYGFYGTMAVSVLLRFWELMQNSSTLVTMAFVFPAIAMLYIIHSNPYDVTMGTVDVRAMEDMVRYLYLRKESFAYLSLFLPEFNEEGKKLPEEMQALVRKYSGQYFRSGILFQIGNGHVVLIARKGKNPGMEKRVQNILARFREQYQVFHSPFKIVIGESVEEISRKNEYGSLIRAIQRELPENTVHFTDENDIMRFNQDEYVLKELTDIYVKQDLDDPRVLAYCQPVFNLKTGRFDSAEALMRLNLDGIGIVSPTRFIPMAESHGYIHVLTEIILNKTCRAIRRMTEDGYLISRISVNVSALELKDGGFCGDIDRIISANCVPGKMLAIELTESQSEADFMIMKNKIEVLRQEGIQFYLDDFGTGYSNMERIMELPFDIIKFDRSLVIASGTNERSEKIVENLANMFREMNYSVLYEGVEDDMDEERCREMSAAFLQGYKYSRPVPIEKLREFLPSAG